MFNIHFLETWSGKHPVPALDILKAKFYFSNDSLFRLPCLFIEGRKPRQIKMIWDLRVYNVDILF